MLSYLAHFEGLRGISFPLRYEKQSGWFVDLDILKALINKNIRAIALVNPNNPTGSFIKKKELEKIDAVCKDQNIALIIDEVFSDFISSEDPEIVRSSVNRT